MINHYIKEKLNNDNITTVDEGINSLREIVQGIVLLSLYKNGFFRNIAFYGGTCLRIFHGLDRFSEDLDFNLIRDENISLNQYEKGIVDELQAYGLYASISKKAEYDKDEVFRRYINIPVYDFFIEYFNNRELKLNKERQLSIKLELDSICIAGATFEKQILTTPNLAVIQCFDMPSLFSGKLHALICRNWKTRVKGRDYYDYLYYLRLGIPFNLIYLQNKLAYTYQKSPKNFDLKTIKELLKDKFENVDFDMIKKDVIPFISSKNDISYISKDMLVSSIELLKC